MVVKVHIVVFCISTPCILKGADQWFRGTYRLHFLGTFVQYMNVDIETGLDITSASPPCWEVYLLRLTSPP
jgi:hypothetical protein